ncbi:uncharacterized protein LOC113235451 [Hyposmocoma kahamanoa]|uniref:uncharacterized protein LOC113235451 n=1 Tax=Hyposmocoma kahamanoa TaxID=1477025 RepID=UPI000E6D9B47|nr:uncharacterized protein LOC113235451 [Hyposmocoma kahamanoa]
MNPNPTHIISILGEQHDKRVISCYNETYLDDDYCDYDHQKEHETYLVKPKVPEKERPTGEQWRSPSDVMLEDWIALKPPFTSRITRGTAHEGILKIGEGVIEVEHNKFLQYVASSLAESDSAWAHIQEQEKTLIIKKVKDIYDKIFLMKAKTMQCEVSKFLEDSLQEIEDHMRDEVKTVIMSTHCKILNDLNTEIRTNLKKEKCNLEKILQKKYDEEINKIKHYYKLLLHNEKYRCNRMINQGLSDQNDAIKAFHKMMEAGNNTSTMYVMCMEGKKCRIRKFFVENFYSKEVKEKLRKIEEKQQILNEFKERKKTILDLNKEWEEKVKKILCLFLKFISFSLKLLPEQTTFLLDLEKLVVLQLNEIQKNPEMAPSMLVNEDDIINLLKFHENIEEQETCEGGPFVIEGDLTPSILTPYGSQETIPSKVDLPSFRVQRQFIYAKCQKLEEVRKFLESQRCKCHDPDFYNIKTTLIATSTSHSTSDSLKTHSSTPTLQPSTESSFESYLIPDVRRLHECPVRGCKGFKERLSFPNLASYLDFDEVNYTRVKTILGDMPKMETPPESIRATDMARHKDLPFKATKTFTVNVETQYSSQDSIQLETLDLECPCLSQYADSSKLKFGVVDNKTAVDTLTETLFKRKASLQRLVHDYPRLLEMFFTDESFKAHA